MLTATASGFDRIPLARRAKAFETNEGGWSKVITFVVGHSFGGGQDFEESEVLVFVGANQTSYSASRPHRDEARYGLCFERNGLRRKWQIEA